VKVNQVRFGITTLICALIMCLMMSVVPGCQKEVKPTGTLVLYTSIPMGVINKVKAEFEKGNQEWNWTFPALAQAR